MATRVIGKSVPRKEGREKVTGRAKYVDDLKFPGMIFGATVRSPVARGRILGIHFEPGIPWDEFTIATAKDIPGKNCIALLIDDQPCLADEFVNHPEEPVVLLAHPDKYLLEEARRSVRFEIEPQPAIFSMDDSLACQHVIWGTDNIFKSYQVNKGHVEHALREADLIVEGTYETGAQEQLYIEPQGMIAQANAEEGVRCGGAAVSVLHSQGAGRAIWIAERTRASGAGGNGRGIWWQGRISVDDCRSRGAACLEIGEAGEDYLRPCRRHGGDDETASIAHEASDGRYTRRKTGGDRHRFHARRWSV